MQVAQQINGVDCGLHVLNNISIIAKVRLNTTLVHRADCTS